MVLEPGPSLAQAVQYIIYKEGGRCFNKVPVNLVSYNNIVYLEKYMGIPRKTLQELNTLNRIESSRSFAWTQRHIN